MHSVIKQVQASKRKTYVDVLEAKVDAHGGHHIGIEFAFRKPQQQRRLAGGNIAYQQQLEDLLLPHKKKVNFQIK